MTDTDRLNQKIKDSGIKKIWISEKCGMSYNSFLNKLNNKTDFTAPEISTLKDVLGLSPQEVNDIFFSQMVD